MIPQDHGNEDLDSLQVQRALQCYLMLLHAAVVADNVMSLHLQSRQLLTSPTARLH